jgi:hypothetical protein
VAGLALGSAGVVLLLEPWALDWSDTQVLVGLGLLLVAAIANAATTVHIRAHRWAGTPFELMPWQLTVAAVPVAILAAAIEGAPDIRWTTTALAIVAYQVLLGSAFGFWGLLTISWSLPAITTNLTLMGSRSSGSYHRSGSRTNGCPGYGREPRPHPRGCRAWPRTGGGGSLCCPSPSGRGPVPPARP